MDFSDMRAYFEAGRTLDPAARIESLRALEAAIRASEGEICQALQADLGKAPLEAYMTEEERAWLKEACAPLPETDGANA